MAEGTKIATAYIQILPEMKDFSAEMKGSGISRELASEGESAGGKFSEGFKTGLKVIGAATLAAGAAIGKFAKESVSAGMDFDASMSQVAATMGTTTDQILNLRDFAQEMGASTAFSATEAAQALNYMALAGYDAETSMEMLPTVLDLAAAGGIDLAYASDMVTDASSALGLSIDETRDMVGQMAKASSKSNTSVSQLGEAFLTIGATARNVKGGTQELSTVLGVLADNGIKGSEGGTHLRNILLSLQAAAKDGAVDFGDFNVQLYDSDGNMRSLIDVIGDMQDGMAGMNQESKDAIVSGVFNKTDLASVNALLGTSRSRFDELSEAIGDAAGAAQEMANTQLDNLAGDITLFKSALEGTEIAISDMLTPTLREFVQLGTEGLSEITKALKEDGIEGAIDVLGDYLAEMINKLGEYIPSVLELVTEVLVETLPNLIVNILPPLIEGLGKISAAIIEALPQILGSIVEAVGSNLGTLLPVIGGVLVTKTGALSSVFDTLKTAMSGAAGEAGGLGGALSNLGAGGIAGLAIGGVALVAAGIATLHEHLKNAYLSASDLWAELEELTAQNGSLAQSIASSQSTYDNAVTASEEQAAAAEYLYGKIQELMDIQGKSAEQQEIISSLVTELNDLVPGLGLAYDAEKDSLNLLDDEIVNHIDLMKQQAQVEAAKEFYIESLKEQYTAQKNLTDSMELLRDTMNKYGLSQEELNAIVSDGIVNGMDFTAMVLDGRISLFDLGGVVEEVSAAWNGYADATLNTKEVIGDVQFAEEQLGISFLGTTGEIVSALDEMSGIWQQAFGEQMPQELQTAVEAAEQAGVDIPASLAENMVNGSVDITAAVDTLNALIMFDEAINTANADGAEIPEDFVSMLLGGMGSITSANDTLNALIQFNDAIAQATADGENVDAGFVAGLLNSGGLQAIYQAASDAGKEAIDGIHDGTDSHSPSAAAESVGIDTLQGLYNGLNNGGMHSSIFSSMWSLGASIISKVKSAMGVHSPSVYAKEIGQFFDEGLAIGIDSGSDMVLESAGDMADGIVGSVSGAMEDIGELSTSEVLGGALSMDQTMRSILSGDISTDLNMPGQESRLEEIYRYLGMVMEQLKILAKMQMVTDTGALVGELAPAMSREFESIAIREGRG